MNRNQLDTFIDVANKALESSGYECIETEWNQHDRILRLFIDHADGVDLVACAKANKILENDGDLEKIIPDNSTLEISSPGIERPIRRLKDFELFIGSSVNVKLKEGYSGKKQCTGRIVSVDAEGNITVETEEGGWIFPVEKVLKARMIYDWQN